MARAESTPLIVKPGTQAIVPPVLLDKAATPLPAQPTSDWLAPYCSQVSPPGPPARPTTAANKPAPEDPFQQSAGSDHSARARRCATSPPSITRAQQRR